MNESDARSWLRDQLNVSRETEARIDAFADFLRREAQSQNLISASTLDHIWTRHIVDSAQLLSFVRQESVDAKWIDLGSGAGFPGLIIALLSNYKVTLVESRAMRVDYLQRAVALLDLNKRVTIVGTTLERLETAPFSVISARAFAPLPRLFELAARFSTTNSLWLLPKGRNAAKEWSEVEPFWNGDFRIEKSLTDAEAGILVGHLTGKRENKASSAAQRQQAK